MTRGINLARFDLVSIRLAVFCAESGSLSAAARRANMSLSRASHRLSSLESSIGQPLFVRHRWGLEPTEAGSIVAAFGQDVLRIVDQMRDRLSPPGNVVSIHNNSLEKSGNGDLPCSD